MRLSLAVLLLLSVPVAVTRAENLAGKVLQDHSGAPVASADVRVYRVGQRELAAELETDSEGRFEAAGLEPGKYRIEIEKSSYVTSTSNLDIAKGLDARLNLRLVRRGSISGRVEASVGKVPQGTLVTLLRKMESGYRPVARTTGAYAAVNESGRYRLYNLSPGQYVVVLSYGAHVSAVASGGILPAVGSSGSGFVLFPSTSRPEPVAISGGDDIRNINFMISAGSLFEVKGKVDQTEGRRAFWVTLTPIEQPFLALAVTFSDQDGNFKFQGIPPGSYHVFATGPVTGRSFMGAMVDPNTWYARSRADVVQNTEGVSLAPHKGLAVSVSLKPEPGSEKACPASATVNLRSLEDWAAMLDFGEPLRAGKEAVFRNLAPARYQLTALNLPETCFQAGESPLDLSSAEAPVSAVIPVAAAGSIHGRVSGARDSAWTIVLESKSQNVRSAIPDGEGRFQFPNLSPGKYRIAARSNSGPANSRWLGNSTDGSEVEVEPGKTAEIELKAPAAPDSQQ